MSTNTTIQFRIDKKSKEKAQTILKKMDIDLSGAMKMFISQIIRTKAMPFVARTENGFTPEYEQMILDDIADAKKNEPRFKTVKELMKDLND